MKKIVVSISALFLFASALVAQTDPGRTTNTKVIDVMAQMPAQNQAQYVRAMQDLASTGGEGVLLLIKDMKAPGKESNAAVCQTLSGLTYFVSAPGNEALRDGVEAGYLKALSQSTDHETTGFIIRQLQIIGTDKSVAPLAAYLQKSATTPINKESLCAPAARALAAIGSPAAGKALLEALQSATSDACKADIVNALGQINAEGAEAAILPLLSTTDTNLKKEVLFALSKCGSAASLPEVAQLAEAAGFQMEPTGANEAYIRLIKTIAANGDTKTAAKAAGDLMKKATKAQAWQSKTAALDIQLGIEQEKDQKLVINALKDPCKEYRNAALAHLNVKDAPAIASQLKKAKPEVKVDILNWLGNQRDEATLNVITPYLTAPLLGKSDLEVVKAAIWATQKIGGDVAMATLVSLLSSTDEAIVSEAKAALTSFSGNIAPAVAAEIASASEFGKVAAIELLAIRKADAQSAVVFEQTASTEAPVKVAAFAALKDVVSAKDFGRLCQMLESVPAANQPAFQSAIIASIAKEPKAKQIAAITGQMAKAGDKSYLYYVVLAATKDPAALKQIEAGFKTGNKQARDAAFDALLDWNGFEPADALYTICKDPSAGAYFDRALNSFISKVAKSRLPGAERLIFLRNAMAIAKTDAQKNEILKQIQNTDTFLGMMYAGNFLDTPALQEAACQAVMNIALKNPSFYGKNVEALLNKVLTVINNPDADYNKKGIKKFMDDNAAGDGFVSLFNGKDLTGWKGLVQNPIARSKMTPAQLAKEQAKADKQASETWVPENGDLVFVGHGDNLCTVKQYGDFEMYVDWLLYPEGPEADAGIYLRGTPQVQIWDTSRTNVGAQVGSGGLYNNQKNRSKPMKVADNKLGEWNSFYIKMVGDRVTVYLNGELVVDNEILENYWDRKQPIFPMEQIELQAHGSKIAYRDIYVKELPREEPFKLSAQEAKEGFKVLFDGTNMFNWQGNTKDYICEEGCIALYPNNGGGGNLYTKDEYADFVFRFEFQLTKAANNGLGIRTPSKGDAAYSGMELQILDNEDPVYKSLQPYQYHGSVYGIIPAKRGFLKPLGEWNYQEVIAKGDNIKVILNGEVIVDGNLREVTKNGTADKKEHPGLFNESGHIGFLGHGSPVKFRNIRVKELK